MTLTLLEYSVHMETEMIVILVLCWIMHELCLWLTKAVCDSEWSGESQSGARVNGPLWDRHLRSAASCS